MENIFDLDNISLASNEEMYAFSNVLASGGNVSNIVKELEKDNAKKKKD